MEDIRRRRRRFPFGGGQSPRVEGFTHADSDISDAEDAGIDDGSSDSEVLDLNQHVEGLAAAAASQVGGRQQNGGEDFTPANRLRQVSSRASNYEREYRLRLLHRLLMRNLPLDTIAAELGVSVSTVVRDRTELYRRLRSQASRMDSNELIGETLGFYTEMQGMALRMASSKVPENIKLAAMRTALTARNDRHRFYQASGVFDVLQFVSDQDSSSSDLERLNHIIAKIAEQDDVVDEMASKVGWSETDDLVPDAEDDLELTLY